MKKTSLLSLLMLLLVSVSAQLNRYPYIQSTTTTSTIVAWKTAQSEMGAVAYGLSPNNYIDTIYESNSNVRHGITLSQLTPNTKYYYAILSGGNVLAAEYFNTAKEDSVNDFSFIQYGDCGFNTTVQHTLAGLMEADDAEFAVVCGDVDQGGVPHISQSEGGDNYDDVFFDIYNDGNTRKMLSRECHYTAIGNHDVYANNGATYNLEFYLPHNNADSSERYYSFTWGDAKFIALDIITPFDPTSFPLNQKPIDQRWWTDFRPGSAQYQFLEDELRCNDKKWVFIYFHEGPWTNYWGADYYLPNALGGDYYQFDGNAMVRQYLVPLFEQYDVDFVMVGHSHLYEKATKNGVWYITSGGAGDVGGNTEYANHPEILLSIIQNHYVKYNVDGNTVSYKAINNNNQIIDSMSLTKPYTDYQVMATILPATCHAGNDANIQLNIQGPKAPYTVEWFNGQTGNNINGLSAGSYYAVISNQYGCSKVSEFVIPETPMDTAQIIDTSGRAFFCENESLYLMADSGYGSYLWSNGATTQGTEINMAGTVNVTIQDVNNCLVYTDPLTVGELSAPTANFGFSNADADFNFLSTGMNATQYIWHFGDGTIDTTANTLIGHTYLQNGTYNVQLIAINDCGTDTIEKSVTVDFYEETAIRDVTLKDAIQIFPNPMQQQAIVKVDKLQLPFQVYLYDITGRLMQQFTSNAKEFILHQDQKTTGVYLLQIKDAKGSTASAKVLIE